jgi:hypothetical protein
MSAEELDPAECGPVGDLTLPSNSPWTGRYAAFRPPGTHGYPSSDDYVVIARLPGEPFRPILVTHVPFDEPPLELQDDPARPENLVLYQNCTLAWTTDGGQTFHGPPDDPDGVFFLHRFGDHWIESVHLGDADIHVRLEAAARMREVGTKPAPPGYPQVWRIPLDGGPAERVERLPPPRPYSFDRHETLLMEGSRAMPWAFLHGRGPPWESEAFLERWSGDGGPFLLARERPAGPFTPVPLIALMRELGDCPTSFFGAGAFVRTISRDG